MVSDKRSRLNAAESALYDVFDHLRPGRNGQELLSELLRLHGSPGAVLEASVELLTEEGLDEDSAKLLSMVPDLLRHMDDVQWGNHPQLLTLDVTERFMRRRYVGRNIEDYHMLALDSSGRLIECVHLCSGNESSVPFYLKRVMSAVIGTNADAVVLCHNHPNCVARPSLSDLDCTRKLLRALGAIGAPLLDHMIMISGCALSIRGFEYISEDKWLYQAPENQLLRHWLDDWRREEAAERLSEYEM